jgi:ketosteroid isomerase-like protein
MKIISMLLMMVVIAAATYAQSAEDRVWDRVQQLTNAIFDKRDSVALLDLVSANVTYGHSSGVIEDKPAMVHKAMVSKTTYKNLQFEKLSMQVKDKVAIVRHNLRATSIDEAGKEAPLDLGIMQVWRKENGKWKIWARQAVRIAPKN